MSSPPVPSRPVPGLSYPDEVSLQGVCGGSAGSHLHPSPSSLTDPDRFAWQWVSFKHCMSQMPLQGDTWGFLGNPFALT